MSLCVRVNVQVLGPSGLHLALRLKRCQQVCMRPHRRYLVYLFSTPALPVWLSHHLSNTLRSHLVPSPLSPPLSTCLTDAHSLWSLLLHSPTTSFYLSLLTSNILKNYCLSSSHSVSFFFFTCYQHTMNHTDLLGVQ